MQKEGDEEDKETRKTLKQQLSENRGMYKNKDMKVVLFYIYLPYTINILTNISFQLKDFKIFKVEYNPKTLHSC